jgi:hypothetical protein
MNKDSFAWARTIAWTVNIGHSTVFRDLQDLFHMKYRYLKCLPHALIKDANATQLELAGLMLLPLEVLQRSHFHGIFPGDESWAFCSNP